MNQTADYTRHKIKTVIEVSELVSIHYFEYTKDYRYHGEQHDFWEIMYVDVGNAFVTCGDAEHLLSRGELIFLPPNRFHNIRADELRPSNVFIISFGAKSDIMPLLAGRVFPLSSEMRRLIRSIVQEGHLVFELPMQDHCRLQERNDGLFGGQQLIRMRLEELMIQIVRQEFSQASDGQSNVLSLRSRFDSQIAGAVMALLKDRIHGKLTLQEITQSLGYGKTYLSAVFTRVYGMSIMSCFAQLKIEEAKYLIRENTMSVTEISEMLGFSSPQHFSKRFRQLVKMSPKQYEASVKETSSLLIPQNRVII